MPTTYAIPNGATQFAATLYTGNSGGSQTILNSANNTNGSTFQPDFLWIKNRSYAQSHTLYDSVRGIYNILVSNSTVAEDTETAGHGLSSFNANGFSLVGDTVNQGGVNSGTYSYVAWQWKGTGSTVSNTNGSITSTVDANTTAGFSIVTYTGTGANATVGHGLGVAPSMVIVKSRNTAGTYWCVYHASLGATQYIYLNTAGAAGTYTAFWNNTAPTSSVFTVGTQADTNGSGYTMVTYCFAPIKGYSAFGSYTGNGSADGPFVYLGFRPRWILLKNTGGTASWYCLDSSRDTYNVMADVLVPNTSAAEVSITSVDFLSNGFKLRTTTTDINGSGTTYIYAAFAENPFKYSLAR